MLEFNQGENQCDSILDYLPKIQGIEMDRKECLNRISLGGVLSYREMVLGEMVVRFYGDKFFGDKISITKGKESVFYPVDKISLETLRDICVFENQNIVDFLSTLPKKIQAIIQVQNIPLQLGGKLGEGSFFEVYDFPPGYVAKTNGKYTFSTISDAITFLATDSNLLKSYVPICKIYGESIAPYENIVISKSSDGYQIYCIQEKVKIKGPAEFSDSEKKSYSLLCINYLRSILDSLKKTNTDNKAVALELKYPNIGFDDTNGNCKFCDLSPWGIGLIVQVYLPKRTAIIPSLLDEYDKLIDDIRRQAKTNRTTR